MSAYEDLAYEPGDGVTLIAIDRPQRMNSLRERTFEELIDAVERADGEADCGVIVLRGAADSKGFCAGGDVEMARGLTTAQAIRTHYVKRMIALSDRLISTGKPVVCAVHGPCVGGGAEISLFCDFVICADDAWFAFKGTDIGGSSWWGGAQLLPLTVGMRRAEEILYSARRVPAAEAAEIGLVTRTVPRERLAAEVDELAATLLDRSATGLRETKSALRATKELLLASMLGSAEQSVAGWEGGDVVASFEAFRRGEAIDWRARRSAG